MSLYSFNRQLIPRHSVTSTSTTSQRQKEEDAELTSHAGVKRQADEDDSESSSHAKRVRLATPEDESECEEMRQEHTLRVQTAVYAAHLLSSSPDKTHSVGINIHGTLHPQRLFYNLTFLRH